MTHRTVPLDLLVRVRDYIRREYDCECLPGIPVLCQRCDNDAELTAQIEQQRDGQGEPVAWIVALKRELLMSAMKSNFTFTRDETIELLGGIESLIAPPATPQDNVPAWAWRQAFREWLCISPSFTGLPGPADAALESRALALAQTKG